MMPIIPIGSITTITVITIIVSQQLLWHAEYSCTQVDTNRLGNLCRDLTVESDKREHVHVSY